MHKSAYIRARVEPQLKVQAEHVLDELGITPTQAVTMLYKKVVREQTFPFSLKIPNKVTQKTLEDSDQGKGIIACASVEEMFKDLGI